MNKLFPQVVDQSLFLSEDITFYQAASCFLLDCQSQGLSQNTIRAYKHELICLNNYLEVSGIIKLRQISADVVRGYLVNLQKSRNPGGVHAAYRVIKTCTYWWECETDYEYRSPLHKIQAPRVAVVAIQGVTAKQVTQLIAACQTKLAVRDGAMIRFLFDSGVRATEFCDLNIEDVDLISGKVNVNRGKGSKYRLVFLGHAARKSLRIYLRTRAHITSTQPLFVTDEGDRFSYTGLYEVLERRSSDASIPMQSPHDFRRGFALECLRNGMDVYTLQHLMGHADLSILMRYLKQSEMDISVSFSKSSPVDNLKK